MKLKYRLRPAYQNKSCITMLPRHPLCRNVAYITNMKGEIYNLNNWEVESTNDCVGSTSKVVGAMDSHWK